MTDKDSSMNKKEKSEDVNKAIHEYRQESEDEDDVFFAAADDDKSQNDAQLESITNELKCIAIPDEITSENKNEQLTSTVEQEEKESSKDIEQTPIPTKNNQEPKEQTESSKNMLEAESDKESTNQEEGLTAISEPNSPKPKPLTKQVDLPTDQNMADFINLPSPGTSPSPSSTISDEEISDLSISEKSKEDEQKKKVPTGVIPLSNINFSRVKPNVRPPREQEAYDENMLKGVQLLFNNNFSEAKSVFETKAKEDPLYALGLSFMSFIKAISSFNPKDAEAALSKLTETYLFADAQIEAASSGKPIKETVSDYFTNLMGTNTTHLPTNTRPFKRWELMEQEFLSNGALRAHIVRAECALLRAVIYLSLETMVGYLKAGINLRKAYTSYSFVWLQYKRMGQNYNKYIDRDTISGIQFGIGSVHLLLSSLPPRVLKIVSAFGWTADRQLGFALLKLCLEGKRIRSPLASLILLSYYVTITSYAPQILTRELIQPAIECLLDAQQHYPNSAFFLFFAGRVSRLSRNLSLSTQSFVYMHEVTQADWADLGRRAAFEIAFNTAMKLDWASVADRVKELEGKYSTPAFLKYFYGACAEMLGQRTEAILAFAEAPKLIDKRRVSQVEQFVKSRVAFFEVSGYQDLDFSLPALEILCVWNLFGCMEADALTKCLESIESTLILIYEREKLEYDLRKVELVPNSAKPDYYDQRGTLLLMKASVLNALSRFDEGIVHLNWIIDNKDKFKHTNWVVPFAYW
ncbi:hypothetical protein G6F35_006442 [Rhizopus arrhizus]|nr:hypothetical protein G6F35_006442 [Rhizopus arrhizus]